jgi:hypothetical protein
MQYDCRVTKRYTLLYYLGKTKGDRMGGSGSGRHADVYNYTVEDCLTVDINWMRRKNSHSFIPNHSASGSITWSRNGIETASIGYKAYLETDNEHIIFHYTYQDSEKIEYRVWFEKTYPNYGGFRYWFLCPAQGCGKRIAKLYKPPGSRYFACRTCQNLTYESCRESHQFDGLYSRIGADMGRSADFVKRVLKNRL